MRAALEGIAPPAIILALALARIIFGDPAEWRVEEPDVQGPEPEVVSAAARAVLDGLEVGDAVGPLEVTRIGGPRDGQITIELTGPSGGMRAWVARRGASQHGAPVHTERFELFYGRPPPGAGAACSDEVSIAVLQALSTRIEAGGAELPAEM